MKSQAVFAIPTRAPQSSCSKQAYRKLPNCQPPSHLAELLQTEPPGADFEDATASLRDLVTRDFYCLTRAMGLIAERSHALAREREHRAGEARGLDGDLLRWSRAAACGGML